MNLDEAYSALRLNKGATLEEVKRSFRALAFELHPDLNQNDPNASARFQLVNEAYVLLKHHVPETGGTEATGSGASSGEAQAEPNGSPWGGERVWTGQRASRAKTGGAGAKGGGPAAGSRAGQGASPRGARAGATRRRRERKPGGFWSMFSGAERKTASDADYTTDKGAGPAAGSTTRQKAQGGERQKSTYGKPASGASGAGTRTAGSGGTAGNAGASSASGFYYEKEEVLQDILRDPFARQVFEEIYNQISREGRATPGRAASSKHKLRFQWGERTVTVNLSRGVWGGAKHWLRRQLDDEQVIRLSGASLRPGVKVRLQITRGWSSRRMNVEVRLPPDFRPGRPVRLKGLGRVVGPWRGDLYLRLVSG